ncbi:synaptic vesicle glycoprotein 2C-like isoform X1 [Entelurus aequoreus]|uniref:synaptic vesicle glycoprotein 2C-like isoform X1 n=1 Tax=Entelurus aequoreus TaxID=161455 RepID=UPI002B1DE01D|nr:synaptic vesicle glycoprotein 2C-like isoform X1 [Entelurus aequoreus]XP_061913414.1 synaptic vesicle glycoprotein 2C-like isoform X1 [Entelurus aequoreus]XP_061913415.1 synaptic vesicle glycoprotein 2C-like isoform X1 [Entelurus aequoreus]XP_061913416.1 synaptic vesicle glycoprotein 2C-like isoform X1 [Entelurus aequoreus]
MNDAHNNRTSLVKGAKDIAKEAKKQAGKNLTKAADRASDEYSAHRSYNQFQNEDDYNSYGQPGGERDEDGASSDATEGHDDEDEIYEGEYQGVPACQDAPVALGQPASDGLKSHKELEGERQADEEELAQQYELIMQECGHGRFQWQLFFVLGLALMSDGVEVFVVGFVLPSAETDMCVPNSGAGWLGSTVYLGMMFGAFFWGGLSDRLGRRQCLLISMSLNGFFAFLSSFVQGYSMFLFCRMLSGFGIGGAVPIVFSYFAEVLAREKRGEHLSWLCMFWMIGGIYASAMAWAIIPHYGWSFSMGSAYQFHSWRVFVVVCAFPCVSAVVALTFMPESPRFFLQMGKHDEAWMVLKQIHDTNMRARGEPERVFTVNRIKIPKQLDELVEMRSESTNAALKVLIKVKTELRGIWSTFMRCFDYPVKDNTKKLAVVWLTLSFGYYGLSVWFPDVIKHLQADEYASRVKIHNNERIEDFTFNFTLENQIHRNGVFLNDRFISMKFKAVSFINSSFMNCYFEDVSSVGSSFKNCTFVDSFFYNTDIDDAKLTNSRVISSSFHHNKTGCQMTFDDDYSAYWVYFVNFLGTLAVLPGNIVSALLMDKIGRLSMLGGSMVLSGISCFFLWFGTSESMMIFMLCLYNGLSISAWNSLDVVTAELYPTDRSSFVIAGVSRRFLSQEAQEIPTSSPRGEANELSLCQEDSPGRVLPLWRYVGKKKSALTCGHFGAITPQIGSFCPFSHHYHI